MEAAIRVEHLSVAIGKKEILHDIHMEIPKGGIISIIGPNGCGKSTLLKAMSRMLQPKEGHVYVYGKDIRSFGRKELARQIAVLPQIHQAPNDVTVEDLVQMGRFPYRTLYRSFSAEDARYVDKALYAVQMHTRKNELVQHLSGGEQQRVWLAVLLAQRSSILFLDEPTTYLDIQHQLRMMKLQHDFLHHLHEPAIWEIRQWARKSGNERHKLLGLARFRELADGMLYCPIAPTCCVVPVMAPHFAKRLASERWVIHDTKRHMGVYYDSRKLIMVEIPQTKQQIDTSDDEAGVAALWQQYYQTIAIAERRNEMVRRSFMPKKYWPSLIEMKNGGDKL